MSTSSTLESAQLQTGRTSLNSSLEPPQQRASFSSLPFEIREQIWLLTFRPRILCLHIHQHVTPPAVDANGKEVHSQRTISVAFNCTVARTYPSIEFQEYARQLVTHGWFDSGIGTVPFWGGSPNPVALYVCRESRELAMKRYEAGFARVDVDVNYDFFLHDSGWKVRWIARDREWKTRRVGVNSIWVDYERDVVVVDTLSRPGILDSEHTPIDPLGLIRTFAKEEAARIQKLAIGGSRLPMVGGQIMRALGGDWVPGASAGRREWLTGFDNVKELLLDDTFAGESPKYTFMTNLQSSFQPGPEGVRQRIVELLQRARAQGSGWSADVPDVRIVGEVDWEDYF